MQQSPDQIAPGLPSEPSGRTGRGQDEIHSCLFKLFIYIILNMILIKHNGFI